MLLAMHSHSDHNGAAADLVVVAERIGKFLSAREPPILVENSDSVVDVSLIPVVVRFVQEQNFVLVLISDA